MWYTLSERTFGATVASHCMWYTPSEYTFSATVASHFMWYTPSEHTLGTTVSTHVDISEVRGTPIDVSVRLHREPRVLPHFSAFHVSTVGAKVSIVHRRLSLVSSHTADMPLS